MHSRVNHTIFFNEINVEIVTKVHLQLKKNEVVYVCILNVYEIIKYIYSILDVLQRDLVIMILSSFKKYT